MRPILPLSRFVTCVGFALMLALLAEAGATGSVDCRVSLDYEVIPAGESRRAIVKVTVIPVVEAQRRQRPPVNLAIVLDRSGSMSGEKIVQAREGAIEILKRLNSQDYFSLVAYGSSAECIIPSQRGLELDAAIARIRQIETQGSTALFAGVSLGAGEVRKHLGQDSVHRVILMSDGLANVGPQSPSELGRLGAALIKEGISVTTVGVGLDYNEDLMTQLSQKSDGNAWFAQTADDLPEIFSKELGDVLSVVASSVLIEIDCGPGVKPLRIIGREGRIEEGRVQLHFNQLYGGRQKFALIEVEMPAGEAGKEQEVAVARCSYRDMLEEKQAESTGRAQVVYSASEKAVEASINNEVVAEFAMLNSAIAQDVTIAMAEEGKVEEAVQNLQFNSKELRTLGKKLNSPALLQQADDLEVQSQELREQGAMSQQQRKTMRTDSYKLRNNDAPEKQINIESNRQNEQGQ